MHLGILTSHPVQYQAPWFRTLAQKVELEVFFGHPQTPGGQGDGGGVAWLSIGMLICWRAWCRTTRPLITGLQDCGTTASDL